MKFENCFFALFAENWDHFQKRERHRSEVIESIYVTIARSGAMASTGIADSSLCLERLSWRTERRLKSES